MTKQCIPSETVFAIISQHVVYEGEIIPKNIIHVQNLKTALFDAVVLC